MVQVWLESEKLHCSYFLIGPDLTSTVGTYADQCAIQRGASYGLLLP
jgi:hypothetical protein